MTRDITPRRPDGAPLDLAVIVAKCTEEGDCWLWRGAVHCGMPVVRHNNRVVNVRRYIAQHIQGSVVDGKLASTRCGNPQCCAPEHVDMITRKELQRRTAKTTKNQQRPSRNYKLAIKARARSTLNDELVAQIRASDLTGRELAALYGVSLSSIQKARNYQSWRDYRSPFAQLIGRAAAT